MNALIDILFSPVNITLTILMLILILYWLVTMISGLDFDVDFDVDIDVDVDADFDTDIEGGNIDFQDISNVQVEKEHIVGKRIKPLKWWQVFLVYFNFVGLPFMFAFTCWIFIWWMLTALVTTITHSYDNSFGVLIMLLAIFPFVIFPLLPKGNACSLPPECCFAVGQRDDAQLDALRHFHFCCLDLLRWRFPSG